MTGYDSSRWETWRSWRDAMPAPVIVAPMTYVSTPELAAQACASGFIGTFPAHNAGTPEELGRWLDLTKSRVAELSTGDPPGPLGVNLVMRRPHERVAADLEVLARHQVPLVIASVGSPQPVVGPLHDAGAMVLADVATIRHAHSALAAGADGLVLLTAGAGGQTGWMNGLAFVRAVREFYDGPVVLAGGVSDGAAVWAAEVLGCDMAYMGTTFIATEESGAEPGFVEAVLSSTMDDVRLTRQTSGIDVNLLPSGLEGPSPSGQNYSAGHTVSAVTAAEPASQVIDRTCAEYRQARAHTARKLAAGQPSGDNPA